MKSAEGKGGRAVCCLHTKYSVLCSQYRQKRIHQKQRHAPSPPDFLCHPGVPDGENGDRGSLHHCQKVGSTRIKLGRSDEIWGTYRMTAGANDAGGAQSSLHTLGSGGMLVTEDIHDGGSVAAALIFHGKCTVWESSALWLWNTSPSFQTVINLTIRPRGPFGPCMPAGPVSPGGPCTHINIRYKMNQWRTFGHVAWYICSEVLGSSFSKGHRVCFWNSIVSVNSPTSLFMLVLVLHTAILDIDKCLVLLVII